MVYKFGYFIFYNSEFLEILLFIFERFNYYTGSECWYYISSKIFLVNYKFFSSWLHLINIYSFLFWFIFKN
jgi:hypothetical protein